MDTLRLNEALSGAHQPTTIIETHYNPGQLLSAAAALQQPAFEICGRQIGLQHPPLVVAEIGINHEGDLGKALRMVDDAYKAGAECVKFQSHVIEDEMIPNDIVPGNAKESIWEMMKRCALQAEEEQQLKQCVESKGMIYLCTPFSRAAAERLESMGVKAYKIGSGECNNYPLVDHIAGYKKPVILSTGMNDLCSVEQAAAILTRHKTPFALLHCTSMYPTPYSKVRLGAMVELMQAFPGVPVGLSDHSLGNYTCYGAAALGACILEKHFTSDKSWPGSDVPISIDPVELRELIKGANAIFEAREGRKTVLAEEQPTINFAYACVVAIRNISKGEKFSRDNIWVKRPGTGSIKAVHFESLLGKVASQGIAMNAQLTWEDIDG